jgi:hypothetical protein
VRGEADTDRRAREAAVSQLDADARRAHELKARAEHEASELRTKLAAADAAIQAQREAQERAELDARAAATELVERVRAGLAEVTL